MTTTGPNLFYEMYKTLVDGFGREQSVTLWKSLSGQIDLGLKDGLQSWMLFGIQNHLIEELLAD